MTGRAGRAVGRSGRTGRTGRPGRGAGPSRCTALRGGGSRRGEEGVARVLIGAELGDAVRTADELSSSSEHHPLRLIHNVKMELVGFYEDPDPQSSSDIRLYISRHYLHEFLDKGPEQCLQERLRSVAAKPYRAITTPILPKLSPMSSRAVAAGLGVWNDVQEIGSRIFSRSRSSKLITAHGTGADAKSERL